MRKGLKRIFWFSAIAAISMPAVLGILILTYPHTPQAGRYDCAIVLGAAVRSGLPSPVFDGRILHGVALFNSGKVGALIFTGGIGKGETVAESQVGAGRAAVLGVPSTVIFLETSSHTTMENLREAKRIMDQNGLRTALVVSDPLHLRRSLQIAHWLGIDAQPSATPYSKYTSWRSKFPFLLREMYFTIHFHLYRQ